MQIQGIQIIGIILAVGIIYQAWELYKRKRFKRRDLGIWTGVGVLLFVFAVLPGQLTNMLSLFTNVGRGTDAILIVGLLGAYALAFQAYIRIQETNRTITDLVRKVALELEKVKKEE